VLDAHVTTANAARKEDARGMLVLANVPVVEKPRNHAVKVDANALAALVKTVNAARKVDAKELPVNVHANAARRPHVAREDANALDAHARIANAAKKAVEEVPVLVPANAARNHAVRDANAELTASALLKTTVDVAVHALRNELSRTSFIFEI
jgi:hypothetical protein